MTFFSHGYVVADMTPASNHIDLSVSLTAGQYLTKLKITGTLGLVSAVGTLPAGATFADQFCAGVQYGAAGYGGTPLTLGNIQSNNWLTWGEMIKGLGIVENVGGTSPINAWTNSTSLIDLDWRGTFYCPQNLDFYTAYGCNPGQVVNFTVNYRFYCEWAGP